MATTKFIGSGPKFPLEISNGRLAIVNDTSLIISSLLMILNWPTNVRYFNENFGARIEELLEEPNDSISRALLRTFIIQAIQEHEKRVTLTDVSIVSYDSVKVNVSISFKIRETKIEETFIFPYYKQAA